MAFLTNSNRTIVLVGLMGSGKTRVGMELAKLANLPFVDSDKEIEKAANMKVADIFESLGEDSFRAGEKKVMLRLLGEGPCVLASGGGAFIQDEIRQAIKKNSISIWLKADLDTLLERVTRTSHRPLLQGQDPAKKLRELMQTRYPVYAEADITVETDHQTPQAMAKKIITELEKFRL